MVKKISCIFSALFILSLMCITTLMGGEFTASVHSTQVPLNDKFILYLTLKDVAPKESPSIMNLKKYFLVHSEQHSTNTTIINGKSSSNITWKLFLTPKTEGVIQIPSIVVDTEEGFLSTEPITLHVINNPTPQPSSDKEGVSIITKVSNASPYKNEPFIYTAILTSKTPLYNVQAHKLQVEGAIVEFIGEPKLEERVIEGVLLNVVEFSYLITPLTPGLLKISPMEIQGAIPQKKRAQTRSFFNDDFDPFAMMQGFDRLQPFTCTTEELQLDVQPVLVDIFPWLTAKKLTIEEDWSNDQIIRVGEPFSRGFLIQAEGLKVSQLPHLEDLQSDKSLFKSYIDKPEEQEKIVQGVIHSTRKEQYTLIPQQAGSWELPAISISWWDSVKKEKRSSTIPARIVQVLPALQTEKIMSPDVFPLGSAQTEPFKSVQVPFFLYGIIGLLTTFLIAALLWIFSLQRKISYLKGNGKERIIKLPSSNTQKMRSSTKIKKAQEKKDKLPDLNPT